MVVVRVLAASRAIVRCACGFEYTIRSYNFHNQRQCNGCQVRRRRRLDYDKIAARILAGQTYREIAGSIGWPYERFADWMRGWPDRPRVVRRSSPTRRGPHPAIADRDRAVAMMAHASANEVARQIGVTARTLLRWAAAARNGVAIAAGSQPRQCKACRALFRLSSHGRTMCLTCSPRRQRAQVRNRGGAS